MLRPRHLAFILGVGWLAMTATRALSFLPDDALISLRYAERLAQGDGLTWNDGERVEGYSNLLWVLLLAGWIRTGADPVLGLRVLGAAATLAAFVVLAGGKRGSGWGVVALAVAGPVAIWAIAGMEQPLVLLELVAGWRLLDAALGSDRRAAWLLAGTPFAALAWTRPDGPLFAAAAAIVLMVQAPDPRTGARNARLFLATPLLAFAGQLAFRLIYYGDWLPNPARVKISPSVPHVLDGLRYAGTGILWLAPLLLLAVVAFLVVRRDPEGRVAALVIAASVAAWTAYVVVVGGDVFPARRHFVPVIAGAAALVTRAGFSRLAPPRRALAGAALLATAGVGVFDPALKQAREERWEWDGRVIARALGTAFPDSSPLFAVDAAGCLPYWSGLPCLDMLGLNDPWLARHRPEDFGRGRLAHELGDGAYFLRRSPDLIMFGPPPGGARAVHRGGVEMQESPEFARRWVLGLVASREDPPLITPIWFRWRSPRIGTRLGPDRVVLPAPVLHNDIHRIVEGGAPRLLVPGEKGRLELRLAAGDRTRRDGVPMEAGRWQVVVESRGRVGVVLLGPAGPILPEGDVWTLSEDTEVTVRLVAVTNASVRAVSLLRDPA